MQSYYFVIETMATQIKIFVFFTFLLLNSVVTQPVPRLSSQTEWRALLDLRSSLGISAKDWHKKANPCLNWTGVHCNNGHITGINLSGLRRTVTGKRNPRFAVDSLPDLSLLSSFNSSGFLLRGTIPEWFGERLKNLEVIDLRSCSIYGSIPSSLGSMVRLNSLYLSNNSITGNMPTTFGKLLSLSALDLSQNSLTGEIPSEISALKNLTRLDLSSNYFSGFISTDFGSLSRLKLLNLSKNSLSSSIPAQLGNLSGLVELDLGSNSLFGELPQELGGLRNLTKLLIANNELEGSLYDALWSMPNLKHLDVSRNNLSGKFPNETAYFNATDVVFNFSNNLFYGNLSYGYGKIGLVDLSHNYFFGSAPNDTGSNIFLTDNCFLILPNQRSLDDCSKFYEARGEPFGNETPVPPLVQPAKSRKSLSYVMIGAFGGLGFIIVITGMLLIMRACNTRRNPNASSVQERGVEPSPKVSIVLSSLGEPFTYEQMLLATDNFSMENLIKQGHSGDLLRGALDGGLSVVVKRVDLRFTRKESFMSELELFSKAKHPRVVPLVGHCLEDESEKFLVYKYMPNGDLSSALHRLTSGEEDLPSLDWITRLKIAIGAAEALSYLHHECTPPVVHRDVQASSILLDDKYEVRLGSFSEVCLQGGGSHQNMVARLLRTPQTSGKRASGSSSMTCPYDVYCFGKVLLELITGSLGISKLNDSEAKQWLDNSLPFISIYEKETVVKIIDQSLVIDDDLLEEVWAVAIVAKSCLNPKASRRPSMRHVLKALENPFKVVREENFCSSGASSRQSWTAAFFGSWQRSSSAGSNESSQTSREIIEGLKQPERGGSRGSGANDHSSSHKRSSSDVFPHPADMQDGTSYSAGRN